MKIALSSVLFIGYIFVLFYFYIGEHKRWLFFYGDTAEKYAIALFEGNDIEVPDALFGYTISASDEYIIFAEPGEHIWYGFFPLQSPINNKSDFNGINWKLLKGKWFVVDD